MKIDFIPDINKYPHIYRAYKNQKLVIFVGAGLSAIWGCKRWKDMAAYLIEECYSNGLIDYWARDNFISRYSISPRKLITIARGILKEKYIPSLQKTLEIIPDCRARAPQLFQNLSALNVAFITTNIDSHLSSLFNTQNVFSDPAKFSLANLKPQNMFHLHGLISDPTNTVLTIDEYIARYQDKKFQEFLSSAFFDEKNCFLFIGYGVDEMEIIDYMVEKYSIGQTSLKRFIDRFYILQPFYQNEETFVDYEQLYFDQINMTVIPYAINTKGYDQINEVIEEWKRELTKPDDGNEFYKFNKLIEKNL